MDLWVFGFGTSGILLLLLLLLRRLLVLLLLGFGIGCCLRLLTCYPKAKD